ncbi:hypothetical protein [Holospora undulata]|uniref:Uncharacterized protein n=1 Tax=Holospora undulata HU1 TaxID=1321371 RepID=A0A061JFS8_9PROT|nr:hypothetical protein [Holospora undulata]ETZ04505.1 hypothetical protein K737_301089 [Holospora undulata HU1]
MIFLSFREVGWLFWGILLVYISIQDVYYRSFPLWSVVVLGTISLWLCPACLGNVLVYAGIFSFFKNFGKWKWNKTYLEWGDVEILALLSSLSDNVSEFFLISGILGALGCLVFRQHGIPFVPFMSVSWCIVGGKDFILP